ncbi:hypothetical protein KAI65_04190 [Candidatus Parcubacteria bacterium]|nr:hypothetical protein [Candidatus Parcubacteria bacterium]
MQNKKRKIIIILTLSFVFIFSLTAVAQAQSLEDAFKIGDGTNEDPLDMVADGAGYNTDQAEERLTLYVAKIINTVLSMLGVLFLVLMLYGGYLWMTAAGKEERVTKAKNLITAAIIGVIIVVSAYAISYFVIDKITSGVLDNNSSDSSGSSGSSDSSEPDLDLDLPPIPGPI